MAFDVVPYYGGYWRAFGLAPRRNCTGFRPTDRKRSQGQRREKAAAPVGGLAASVPQSTGIYIDASKFRGDSACPVRRNKQRFPQRTGSVVRQAACVVSRLALAVQTEARKFLHCGGTRLFSRAKIIFILLSRRERRRRCWLWIQTPRYSGTPGQTQKGVRRAGDGRHFVRPHERIADLDERKVTLTRALDDSPVVHKMRRVSLGQGLLDFASHQIIRGGHGPAHLVGKLSHRLHSIPLARGKPPSMSCVSGSAELL